MRKAVLLDRDGVIIDNVPDYVRFPEQVRFLPGAVSAIAVLKGAGFLVAVITNQSAIGRRLITYDAAAAINEYIVATLESSGVIIDGLYMCPHAPEVRCSCRKPEPGLLWQAQTELAFAPEESWLVGDHISDVEAGLRARVTPILVRTGRGADAELELDCRMAAMTHVVDDLACAAELIMLSL